jgi:hypothetical protein
MVFFRWTKPKIC